jgi:hypothetical protein
MSDGKIKRPLDIPFVKWTWKYPLVFRVSIGSNGQVEFPSDICFFSWSITMYLNDVMTRSYYRKGSAASPPKSWGLIIPINFIYLNCLIHTVCMNFFFLRNIEITTCNNYYIYYIKCSSDFQFKCMPVIVGTNVLNHLHLSKRLEEHN